MRKQLQEVTAKRVEAERQLKLLKDDLAKNAAFVEKKRDEAILGSVEAVNQLRETMEQELREVRDDTEVKKLLEQTQSLERVAKNRSDRS